MLFCGHDYYCAEFNSERALRQAKENVERYYSVVGVIEEVNKTLAVLEAAIPEVFSGTAHKLFGAEGRPVGRSRSAGRPDRELEALLSDSNCLRALSLLPSLPSPLATARSVVTLRNVT